MTQSTRRWENGNALLILRKPRGAPRDGMHLWTEYDRLRGVHEGFLRHTAADAQQSPPSSTLLEFQGRKYIGQSGLKPICA